MKLEHSFTVPVSVEQAWEVLLDIERVAPCMPGAVLDSVDGDSFTGRVKIKLGPVNLTYKGAASFIEKDAAARRVVLDANGKDARGNGTAAAKVTATLVGQGDSTQVNVVTDLNITGKPAQFGRGVMVDVGNKLIGQFASCLETKIGAGSDSASAAAVDKGSGSGASTDASTGASTDAAAQEEVPVEDSGAAQPESAPPAAASAPVAASAPTTASAPTATPATTPAPAPAAAPTTAPPRKPATEPEPIDLLELAGGSLMTRAAPVAGGVAVLLLLFYFLRRRR
ncbi:MAG: SRPBCC family protein [Geodermatophilaceae bacterium]|nr:SRPBCC family protein [Geodermatophilaceae bacterium]MDQ3466302.1 SRPBCC family protein [Actinomycetota bacterium]